MRACVKAAAERTEQIYRVLSEAADNQEPCPSNPDLGKAFKCGAATISVDISRLEQAGRIRVTRTSMSRIVTIVATGMKTAKASQKQSDEYEESYMRADIRKGSEALLAALRREHPQLVC